MELIIVLSIIAVLVAGVALTLAGFIGSGEETACEADQRSLQSAVAAFRVKAGEWPTTGGTLEGDIRWDAVDGTGNTFVPDYVLEIPRSDGNYQWKIDGSGKVVTSDDGDCPSD